MARPRSEEKQIALLEAATEVVASVGIGAPTSVIAKKADVSEGTLFRYFPTKDDLLNELYLYLKQDLCEAMIEGFDRAAPIKERARTLWYGYVDWGIAHPTAKNALRQLSVSEKITEKTQARAAKLFPDMEAVAKICVGKGLMAKRSSAFRDAIFMALADTTMEFAANEPKEAEAYKTAGFKVLWDGMIE